LTCTFSNWAQVHLLQTTELGSKAHESLPYGNHYTSCRWKIQELSLFGDGDPTQGLNGTNSIIPISE